MTVALLLLSTDTGSTSGLYVYADAEAVQPIPITWTAWASGEPNYTKTCVYARRVGGLLQWFTDNCNALFYYVCETRNDSVY